MKLTEERIARIIGYFLGTIIMAATILAAVWFSVNTKPFIY